MPVKMPQILVGAVVLAATAAGIHTYLGNSAPREAAVTPEPQMLPPARPGSEMPAAMPSGDSISGEVLEVIDVPSYTYVRLGTKGTEGKWAAVSTAKVEVGARVTVVGAVAMNDFKSKVLGRTFPVIYFGALEGAAPPRAKGGEPRAPGADPHAMGAPPAGDPHGQAGAAPPQVEVKKVAKAEGPDGRTVAETLAQRVELRGKTVRIRGTVVKVMSGILGKTYLHLRDGSGPDADITVTTAAEPKAGDVVVLEGVVATDIDIGSGYKFPTLLSDAKVVN
jgi:hypothetical protein